MLSKRKVCKETHILKTLQKGKTKLIIHFKVKKNFKIPCLEKKYLKIMSNNVKKKLTNTT